MKLKEDGLTGINSDFIQLDLGRYGEPRDTLAGTDRQPEVVPATGAPSKVAPFVLSDETFNVKGTYNRTVSCPTPEDARRVLEKLMEAHNDLRRVTTSVPERQGDSVTHYDVERVIWNGKEPGFGDFLSLRILGNDLIINAFTGDPAAGGNLRPPVLRKITELEVSLVSMRSDGTAG